MNADIDALTRAVVADPGDDLARLAYADACEEAGHALRAEFVRLQLRLAKATCAVLPMRPFDNYVMPIDTLRVWDNILAAAPWAVVGDLVPLAQGGCMPIGGFEWEGGRRFACCRGEDVGPMPAATQDPADRAREHELLPDPAATWLPPGWSPLPRSGALLASATRLWPCSPAALFASRTCRAGRRSPCRRRRTPPAARIPPG